MLRNLARVGSSARSAMAARQFSALAGEAPIPENLWKLGKLNHVAIAVPDLQKSMSLYRNILGAKVSEPEPQEEHGVYTVFVEMGIGAKIELIHPLGDKSPIKNFLAKNPDGGIHHICLECNDIHKAMDDLKEKKIRLLADKPKIGAHGNPVVFLHPKDTGGVLVELEETTNF